MSSSVETLLQFLSGALEALRLMAFGRNAKHEVLVALTPIAVRLQAALAQVPFAAQGQLSAELAAEVRKLDAIATRVRSKLPAAQQADLDDLQKALDRFLPEASHAGYSEAFAVLRRVRQLREGLR